MLPNDFMGVRPLVPYPNGCANLRDRQVGIAERAFSEGICGNDCGLR